MVALLQLQALIGCVPALTAWITGGFGCSCDSCRCLIPSLLCPTRWPLDLSMGHHCWGDAACASYADSDDCRPSVRALEQRGWAGLRIVCSGPPLSASCRPGQRHQWLTLWGVALRPLVPGRKTRRLGLTVWAWRDCNSSWVFVLNFFFVVFLLA